MMRLQGLHDARGEAGDAGGQSPAGQSPWMEHMRCGRWEQAWAVSDGLLPARARTPCTHLPRHLQYVWTGAELRDRRVLVRCYHGLGDTLQFVRYMPMLRALASEVILWVQPSLIPLLRGMAGIDRLLALHDGTPEVEFDVDIEIMELPHAFRTTVATVPGRSPYLAAEPMRFPQPFRRPAVGIVWKAGDWDGRRSIPFRLMLPFAALRGVSVFILQPGAVEAGWDGRFGIFPGEFNLRDYARAVRAMDLLVTVDSMPAHMAGALGVPVWTLLPTDADWRWLDDREDSPWYPRMRLFRQRSADDWEPVIASVLQRLDSMQAQAPDASGSLSGCAGT
jgi:hypothetical protein